MVSRDVILVFGLFGGSLGWFWIVGLVMHEEFHSSHQLVWDHLYFCMLEGERLSQVMVFWAVSVFAFMVVTLSRICFYCIAKWLSAKNLHYLNLETCLPAFVPKTISCVCLWNEIRKPDINWFLNFEIESQQFEVRFRSSYITEKIRSFRLTLPIFRSLMRLRILWASLEPGTETDSGNWKIGCV